MQQAAINNTFSTFFLGIASRVWWKRVDFTRYFWNDISENAENDFTKIFQPVWKSTVKRDHDFCRKIKIFSVKSAVLLKKLLKN